MRSCSYFSLMFYAFLTLHYPEFSFQVEVGQCVATCEGIPDGHYTSCDSCTEYVSCGGGQFFGNRPCKTCSDEDITCEELYWNDILKYCTPTPSTCIPNSLIGFWPLNCHSLGTDVSGMGHSAEYNPQLSTTPSISCSAAHGLIGAASFTPKEIGDVISPVYLEVQIQHITMSGLTWVGYIRMPLEVFTDENVPIFAFERNSSWSSTSKWAGLGIFWKNSNIVLQMNRDSKAYAVTVGTGMGPNDWYKLAVRYNADTGYLHLRCSRLRDYLDTMNYGFNTNPGIIAYTKGRIRFGLLPSENNGGNSKPFRGQLSCVRLWNYALSDQELHGKTEWQTLPAECKYTVTAAPTTPSTAEPVPDQGCSNSQLCWNPDQALEYGKEIGVCVPTASSHYCRCPEGYRWEVGLYSCVDVDETRVGNCGCEDVCTNQLVDRDFRKYLCSCSDPNKNLAPDNHTCIDKNEDMPSLKVWPLYGPKSGGTVIDIQDDDLSGELEVYMDDTLLTYTRISPTHVQVTTLPLVDTRLLNTPQDFTLILNDDILAMLSFTYMEDPVIKSVEPLKAIAAGGTILTVMGENMDTVANPVLVMVQEDSSAPTTYTSRCKGLNGAVMHCPTPVVDLLTIHDETRRRRQANTDRELGDLYIGFELDGVDSHRDMRQSNPEFSEVTVVMNPEIDPFPGDGVIEYDLSSGAKLDIKGEYMDQGATTTDYTIMVEAEECTDLEMFSNVVSCVPPNPAPQIQQTSMTKEGLHHVMVYVGYYTFSLGHLKYINKSEETGKKIGMYVGIACGLIAVLAIVILVCYCCCCRKRSSGKGPGYEDHHDFTFRKGMNMPPSLETVDGTMKNHANGKQGMGQKTLDYYCNDNEFDTDFDMKMRKKQKSEKEDGRYDKSPVKGNQDYEVSFYSNDLYETDEPDSKPNGKKVGNDYLNIIGSNEESKQRDYVNIAAENKAHDYINMEKSITQAETENKAKNVEKKKENLYLKKAKPSSNEGYLAPSMMNSSQTPMTKVSNVKPNKPHGLVKSMYELEQKVPSSAAEQYNRSVSLEVASSGGSEAMKRAQNVFGEFKKPTKRY